MSDNDRILRRYTSLPALLHLLRSRKLTLLSPEKWEDRNDAYYMSQYRERSEAISVLALCFSEAPEKYHLWRAFTHGTDGVCIEFERNGLLASFDGIDGIEKRRVTYKLISDISNQGRSCTTCRSSSAHPTATSASSASYTSTTARNARLRTSLSTFPASARSP